MDEREHISIGLTLKKSIRQIAKELSRSPSTICREINKNGGVTKYQASKADASAWKEAKRPKLFKLDRFPLLKEIINDKLKLKWSPDQISGWLRIRYPTSPKMWISHETIYKSLYIRFRKLLDSALVNNLRAGHKMRQSMHHSRKRDRGTIRIVNGVFIQQRPLDIEERASTGH